MKQTIIHFDGTLTETEVTSLPDLDTMQKIVGGYIQMCPNPQGTKLLFVVNEDGISMGLPYNRAASERYADVWLKKYKRSALSEDRLRLYGVVIVFQGTLKELEG